ncbi:hypothetical protein QOT17_016241 [Balamuthia mandrillaris]
MEPEQITICGAGNLAHVWIGLWGSRPNLRINLLTRRPDEVLQGIEEGGKGGIEVLSREELRVGADAEASRERSHIGRLHRVSADPAEVIPGSDLILLTVPSQAREALLRSIAPHLRPSSSSSSSSSEGGEGEAAEAGSGRWKREEKRVMIGAVPAMGGFDYVAAHALGLWRDKAKMKHTEEAKEDGEGEHEAEEERDNKDGRSARPILFGLKDIPYTSRCLKVGQLARCLGPKAKLFVAVAKYGDEEEEHEKEVEERVRAKIEELHDIPTAILPHFLNITLTPGNPIMHPSILWGRFGPCWDGIPLVEPPLFYQDMNELSASTLKLADMEVQLIRRAVERQSGGRVDLGFVWPLQEAQVKVYEEDIEDKTSLWSTIRSNKSYRGIRTPLKQTAKGLYTLDPHHRYFQEDVPFGLVLLRSIADLVGVEVAVISMLIRWAQRLMGKEYLDEANRLQGRNIAETAALSVYGIDSLPALAALSPAK